ncbi:MAG TPA: 3-hydroxyacyl-CoA dehydrogenase NAD-binding domain-containing protein [Chitinophagaceae bacterium]|nr:3-hydroxyacyl-CoA dehydrogenase NAD-binding domain-containing protein [Chitinophagaceae bacterium]
MMRIIVCGAGTMGTGIAETSARSGYTTLLYEPRAETLEKAEASITGNLKSLYDKMKISGQEMKDTLGRLRFSSDLSQCIGELVIEAIIEDVDVKSELFSRLAGMNSSHTILATNTSSLSVAAIAENIPGPERFCGMHFFNPAQLMKLVELVYGPSTSVETIQRLQELAVSMGKTPVVCKDSPGFIVNRVARHYYLEALQMLEEGVCNIEQADRVLENAGFKMGPFRLMDLIGNDINFTVTRSLYEACGKPIRFRPSAIQEQKILKGELGRKTGKGYYSY